MCWVQTIVKQRQIQFIVGDVGFKHMGQKNQDGYYAE